MKGVGGVAVRHVPPGAQGRGFVARRSRARCTPEMTTRGRQGSQGRCSSCSGSSVPSRERSGRLRWCLLANLGLRQWHHGCKRAVLFLGAHEPLARSRFHRCASCALRRGFDSFHRCGRHPARCCSLSSEGVLETSTWMLPVVLDSLPLRLSGTWPDTRTMQDDVS